MPQRNRKRKKRNALFAPVAFLIICAALVFGLSVFFRVSTIEVEGNSLYTSEEIKAQAEEAVQEQVESTAPFRTGW